MENSRKRTILTSKHPLKNQSFKVGRWRHGLEHGLGTVTFPAPRLTIFHGWKVCHRGFCVLDVDSLIIFLRKWMIIIIWCEIFCFEWKSVSSCFIAIPWHHSVIFCNIWGWKDLRWAALRWPPFEAFIPPQLRSAQGQWVKGEVEGRGTLTYGVNPPWNLQPLFHVSVTKRWFDHLTFKVGAKPQEV